QPAAAAAPAPRPAMVTQPVSVPAPPPAPAAVAAPPALEYAPPTLIEEGAAQTIMMNLQSLPVAPTADDDPANTLMMQVARIEAPASEDEQKLHEDAKRFARLLVSEIKLYNEAQVSAGREKKDLYDRLKDDIERSRRMYQERVPQHIHTTTNYFYE